jgi:ATP-dependent RNA helicase DDX10/DBP4
MSGLKMLVLDEADRLLDLGFMSTLNALIEYLPPSGDRQTLLFSATQTRSVRDLARLSLAEPEYIAVDEAAGVVTPQALKQHSMICELNDKLAVVWSFIKTHLKHKTIVFFSACKEVRYVHEVFSKMRPGVPVMAIHGKQKQMKRMAIFTQFCTHRHGARSFSSHLSHC